MHSHPRIGELPEADGIAVENTVSESACGPPNIALTNGQLETGCNAGVFANCSALGDRVFSGEGLPGDGGRAVREGL
jgi:hypothetical protein